MWMVREHLGEHPSEWAAMSSIASKFGMATETLRKWVRRAEVDWGTRPGLPSEERERLRQLERENRELRRLGVSAVTQWLGGSSETPAIWRPSPAGAGGTMTPSSATRRV